MKTKKGPYYNIGEDLEEYPHAWCFIIVGGRNTGKTYSALKYYYDKKEPVVFLKRHNKDIDLLCAGAKIGDKAPQFELDLDPYKPLNRDLNINIKAFKIDDGIGAFYETDAEGMAKGKPVGYLLSLFAVSKWKGFDLSECQAIIFDEFIPQNWDRLNRTEGEQLMELYKTVDRDRTIRGGGELRLLCLANAVNVFNYTAEVLEVTDTIAEMSIHKTETLYQDGRGIFIRILETPEEMLEAEKKTGIYKAMEGTAWARMAFGNEFAYNDFSNIRKMALKNFRPFLHLHYKQKDFYIYSKDGLFYMCTARASCPVEYDLNKEMHQRAFWYNECITLVNAAIDGRMLFEKFTMYDLITNYKKRFRV